MSASEAPKSKRAGQAAPGTLRRAFIDLRKRRLASASLVVFGVLLLLSLFADFWASSYPLFGSCGGESHFLANVTHPAALARKTPAERRACVAEGATFTFVHHGADEEDGVPLAPPLGAAGHPLGTDERGRDVFAVLVYGARTVFAFALACAALSVVLGATVGALAGFFGGAFDATISRSIEVLTAFPSVVLVLAVQAVLPHPTTLSLLVTIGCTRWAEIARVVRSEVLRATNEDYVVAARVIGASPLRVLTRHIAPHARAQAMVAGAFALSTIVLVEASSDFLGIGVNGAYPTWGTLMGQVRHHPEAWWLLVFPGTVLFVTVAAQNIFAETLRDTLDPRQAQR
ncbi:MAG: ABC transporter permease [Polyangiaceae bacterium]